MESERSVGEIRKGHLKGIGRKSIKRFPGQLIRRQRGGKENRAKPAK